MDEEEEFFDSMVEQAATGMANARTSADGIELAETTTQQINKLRKTVAHGNTEVVQSFKAWSGYGEAYFTELLEHLRRCESQPSSWQLFEPKYSRG